jgi:hypothetical protein
MEHRILYIGKWHIDFLFAEEGYDREEALEYLYDCGASDYALRQAENLMVLCEWNCGFTFANPLEYRAVVFIGPTSSSDEFINTTVHEVHHLAVAIAEELGIDLESETPAYIAGDSAKALADVICQMGCPHCHAS